MAMRRAAYAPGSPVGSAKLGRLVEIVEEASANGRKVVVFSYFRDVLDTVAAVLGAVAIGPLTGSVPPVQRQALVDEFGARRGPAVLVSQIQAGGVGLNIQAASVVILTEPQWKPTIEDQAIARCHRMGQVRSVDVHRLLAEDSVDQRMLEILATKARPVRRVRPPQRAEGPQPRRGRRLRPEGRRRGRKPGRSRAPDHRDGAQAPPHGSRIFTQIRP